MKKNTMNTTPKQLAANRRNAMKSTGPRTPKGRAVSKMNALKHGILSKQVLVKGLSLQESEEELEALHRRFWEDLQPVGVVEEMLTDQIVTAHWRLRRALTAESGEIALSVDTGERQRSRGPDAVLEWMKWRALGDPIHDMEGSALGAACLRAWMRKVREAVETEGALTETIVKKFSRFSGAKPNIMDLELEALLSDLDANPDGVDAATLRERNKAGALAFLDQRISEFQERKERAMKWDIHEEEARQAAAVLPSTETLEKILRYETKLERQMHRAMAQLERVQRMRRGEAIPAPLTVEVSDRG